MSFATFLACRRPRRLLALALALALAPVTLAGVDAPTSSGPTSGSGAGNYSAGDETVGTLPSVHDDTGWPSWLRPGDRLVLEGSVQQLGAALATARGHGSLTVELLEASSAGPRARVVLGGSWSLSLSAVDLADGALTVAVLVQESNTTALVSGPSGRHALQLQAGELLLPAPARTFALQTSGSLGVRTHVRLVPTGGTVALDLRTH